MSLGQPIDVILQMSLERIELLMSAALRSEARRTLELAQGFALAQGGDRSAWRQFQQRLIDGSMRGLR